MKPSFRDLAVSVITPVRDGDFKFEQCLQSLMELNPSPLEIILVVDGGVKGSWPQFLHSSVRVMEIPEPGGPAVARNRGAAQASGDILFFVDADVMVQKDTVGRIKTTFSMDPSLAALIGSYDDKPGETNFFSQFKNLFHHYIHQTSNENASTFWGACGAVRREVFQAMGGFEERYKLPSVEDIELGYRMKRGGYKIRLIKGLQVKHLKRWGAASLLKSDIISRALPWTELIIKDRRFINDLNLQTSSRLSALLSFALLTALSASVIWSGFWPFAGGMIILLLILNRGLYYFFLRARGLWFTVRAIIWHWFYYVYSGATFIFGIIRYYLRKLAFSPGMSNIS